MKRNNGGEKLGKTWVKDVFQRYVHLHLHIPDSNFAVRSCRTMISKEAARRIGSARYQSRDEKFSYLWKQVLLPQHQQ